ncbi:unnamed protein product, partial [Closterium sp. Naga37s-1]
MLHAFDPLHAALEADGAGNSPADSAALGVLPAPPKIFLPVLPGEKSHLPDLLGLPGLPGLLGLPDLTDLAPFAAIHWFGSRLNCVL